MADRHSPEDRSRETLRSEIRARLPALCGPVRILAEGALGAEAPIDLLAVTPEGRLVLVLVGEADRDLELVGLALAQRAWIERRRRDLAQLVPGVRADLAPRVVLLATQLRFATRLALESLAELAGMDLVCAQVLRPAGSAAVELVLEPSASAAEPADASEPPATPRSRFRSRLTDADLGLGSDETA